ncbi:hypothetical protein F5Y16DRAFT_420162 [Xylariaceae sp. FL0255]|nr:hypothetical protein F5Y16DRAFT_420162 [Xylariaceae sp. FL0255]
MVFKSIILFAAAFAGLVGAYPTLPAELPTRIIQGTSPDPDSLELTAGRKMFDDLYKAFGQEAFLNAIESNLTEADTYWNKIFSENKGGRRQSLVVVQGYTSPSILNATTVLTWNQATGTGFPNQFLETNPQHWLSYSGPGVAATPYKNATSINVETYGNGPQLTTYFYATPITKPSWMPAISEFPADQQIAAQMLLRDGSLFAHGLTAVRTLPGNIGVELYQSMWIPDNTDDWVYDGLTYHLTIEFTNWLRKAYEFGLAHQ